MARPGDDDFVWGDFEDFSDFEYDLEELEAAENSAEDASIDQGASTSVEASGSGTTATFACNACDKVYQTAGWLSWHKTNKHGSATEDTEEPSGLEKQRDDTEEAGGREDTKKAKKAPRKLKVQRPTSNFTKEDAVQAGPELLLKALEEEAKCPISKITVGKKPTPGEVAAQTAKELLDTLNVSEHTEFVASLCSQLWDVIVSGDSRTTLCTAANELMYSKFYSFCTGQSYKSLWADFMENVGKDMSRLLRQTLTRTIFEGLLKKRHMKDAPIAEAPNVDTKISTDEEQVVRYIAGFIPYALLKKYRRLTSNNVAKLYCTVLQEWSVSSVNNTSSTFLEYTEGWLKEVNRGGLFMVSNTVYVFFRHIETVVRSTANLDQLSQGKLQGLRDNIIKNLETTYIVNHYWCEITGSHIQDEKLSKNLLDVVLLYYVNLRCRAFADAYVLVEKAKNSDFGSKKGEKSLRKSLDK